MSRTISAGTHVSRSTSSGATADSLTQLVEPGRPPSDELGVVETFLDDDADDAQRERQVGAGPQSRPHLRPPRVDGIPGSTATSSAPPPSHVPSPGGAARSWPAGPSPRRGRSPAVLVVATRIEAVREPRRRHLRHPADVRRREGVRRAEDVGEASQPAILIALGDAADEGDALGAVRRLGRVETGRDESQRVVPGDFSCQRPSPRSPTRRRGCRRRAGLSRYSTAARPRRHMTP